MENKNYLLSQEELLHLVNYLKVRPYTEVSELIKMLANLKQVNILDKESEEPVEAKEDAEL